MAKCSDYLGTQGFFREVFAQAGIPVSSKTAHFLQRVGKTAGMKREREKTPAYKWKRAKNKKLQMADDLRKDAEARHQGTDYGTGVAVFGGDVSSEMDEPLPMENTKKLAFTISHLGRSARLAYAVGLPCIQGQPSYSVHGTQSMRAGRKMQWQWWQR